MIDLDSRPHFLERDELVHRVSMADVAWPQHDRRNAAGHVGRCVTTVIDAARLDRPRPNAAADGQASPNQGVLGGQIGALPELLATMLERKRASLIKEMPRLAHRLGG